MADKTTLQRDIMLDWYQNPNATDAEIADRVGCSTSYVNEVRNKFDDYSDFEATLDAVDQDIEQLNDAIDDDIDNVTSAIEDDLDSLF